MLNTNQLFTADVLRTMRVTVERAIGITFKHSVGDVINNAVVRCIDGVKDGSYNPTLPFQQWANVIARNEAYNYAKRHENHNHVAHATKGEDGEQIYLVDNMGAEPAQHGTFTAPNGRDAVEAMSNAQWLEKAMLAVLTQDERRFVLAISGGATQAEAGALVGWSAASSSRKRKEIAAKMARAYASEDDSDLDE